jgi:hypothetical protein
MELYRCGNCNLVWKKDQLIDGKCPQTICRIVGASVKVARKTKAIKSLIRIYEAEKKE